MSYLDVITLEEAKIYLRIDDTLTEDDDNITRMIYASLSFVEKWTNILVYNRTVSYLLEDGFKRIYDWPITEVLTPAEFEVRTRTLFSDFRSGYSDIGATMDVGFVDPLDVPQELREVAFQIIDILYYKAGNNKPIQEQLGPVAMDMLHQLKRFIM
jgi:hypothetical protein